jgi:hypothetical protein
VSGLGGTPREGSPEGTEVGEVAQGEDKGRRPFIQGPEVGLALEVEIIKVETDSHRPEVGSTNPTEDQRYKLPGVLRKILEVPDLMQQDRGCPTPAPEMVPPDKGVAYQEGLDPETQWSGGDGPHIGIDGDEDDRVALKLFDPEPG